MSTKSAIHQAHLNEWAIRLSDQKASGLSVTDWCEQNNISIHKYFYWKRLLKKQAVTQMLPDIVPVSLPSVTEPAPVYTPTSPDNNFHPLASCSTCECAKLTINGIIIELD